MIWSASQLLNSRVSFRFICLTFLMTGIRSTRGLDELSSAVWQANRIRHPYDLGYRMYELLQSKRAVLISNTGSFDGFPATVASASKTCLVRIVCNRYSVQA